MATATQQAEQDSKRRLHEMLEELARINPQDLGRTDLGVAFNFEECVPVFAKTLKLFNTLRATDLDMIPHKSLQLAQNTATLAR